jgi:hypothetical protein
VADHQIAHIYFPALSGRERRRAVAQAKNLLGAADGVAEVLDAAQQARRGLRHARSGDLVCVAAPDAWFSYYWWLDDRQAPDFARTVDIHRKPGYDPVELFFDPRTRSIPLEAGLVRGAHGRAGADDPKGIFLTTAARAVPPRGNVIKAENVAARLLAALGR